MTNFSMPVLVDILGAQYTAEGLVNVRAIVTNHCGDPNEQEIWNTRDPKETTLFGMPYTFGLEIDEWLASHPKFKIAPYVAPPPEPEPTPEEKFDRWVESSGLTKEQIKALLK